MFKSSSETTVIFASGKSSSQWLEVLAEKEDAEDIKTYMDISIPDEMLKTFCSQFSLSRLLNKPPQFFDTKVYMNYKFRGQTYTATVYNYKTFSTDDTIHRQLTIKLSNDGFRYYSRKFIRSRVTQHKYSDWFVLGEDTFDDMKFLKSVTIDLDAKVVFYYNIKHKRIDIKFFCNGKEKSNDYPEILIIFEPGNPIYDEERSLRF
ncbi:hypothetical protein HK099_000920 [Clydaea vesicula]|uniref:Uncharacterized protein n=1 Tax=Clydaea vesicula TaxID=447962 RepID=A0AAD5XSE3_9FUNG|nr:hypothetical protein HK099_000920 [Clydaea vesicula]